MKKYSALAPFILLTLILSFSACKKDSNTPSAPSNTAPSVSAPNDADGAFVALLTRTKITVPYYGSIDQSIGTAAGWFGTSAAYVDGGALTCNDSTLTKQSSSNAYIYQVTSAGTGTSAGLSFSDNVTWVATGNAGNGVPPINYTHYGTFPYVLDISGSTSDVSTTADYTLSASTYVTGDSVIFVVSGPNGHVTKIKGPNTASCVFTAAEMGTLGTGDNVGLLQIAPYSLVPQTISGKKYYFIKESVVSKIVNLK